MSAKLTFHNPAQPVVGKQIVFSTNSKALCSATTNTSGVANCTISAAGSAAVIVNGGFTATFNGSLDYLPGTAHGQLIG